ncbi:unnamed protein product [Closterium sp. NIES-64]|nr:unnamed protein product [Closterium sp. NIES-64]
MRSVPDRKRPQKVGGSRMDQGGTGDLHDQANAALRNPILLWRSRKRERLLNAVLSSVGCQEVGGKLTTSVRVQAQDRKVRVKTLAELETGSADPRDQDIRDLILGAQGEDCGVARVVVNNYQEVPLLTLTTDAGWAPHVHVECLQGSSRQGERGGVRSDALPSLDTGEAGRSRRGWEGRKDPGQARDKVPGVHGTKPLHRRVAKAVVPEDSLFVENEGRWRPDSVPNGTAGQGRTVEEVAMTGPPEGSARETATGRASGSRAVRSRKKQREAPESSVKVCSAAVDAVPRGADTRAPRAAASPAPGVADTRVPGAVDALALMPGSGGTHKYSAPSPLVDITYMADRIASKSRA